MNIILSILFPILNLLGDGIKNDAGGPALIAVGIAVILGVAAVIITVIVVVVMALRRMRKNNKPKDE